MSDKLTSFDENRIVIGKNAWVQLDTYLDEKKYKKIGIVIDENIEKLFYKDIINCLTNTDKVIKIDGVSLKKINASHKYDLDCVVGVGGGTNIDQAKMIALESGCHLVVVPTKPTAAIISKFASVPTINGRATINTPKVEKVFINNYISIPKELLLAEYGDMLSSWSAIPDAVLADMENREEADVDILKEAYERGKKIIGIKNIQEAESIRLLFELSIEIGVIGEIYGSTRPSSGTEHKISHAMDEILPSNEHNLHGIQVALGVLATMYIQLEDEKLQNKLTDLGFEKITPDNLRKYMREVGLACTFSELNINADKVKEIMKLARSIRPEPRYTIIDKVSDDQIMAIFGSNSIL